jgi:hypothetical protein
MTAIWPKPWWRGYKKYAFRFFHDLCRMYLGEACKAGAPQFENGTTNGAGWYPLTGGMQVCTH